MTQNQGNKPEENRPHILTVRWKSKYGSVQL